MTSFLDGVLPLDLEVGTGEVWDSSGNSTDLLDVVVHRNDTPRLTFGAQPRVTAYFVEGVYAVVEVKSTLHLDDLRRAVSTLQKVEQLRPGKAKTLALGIDLGRPTRAIFAFDGCDLETISKELVDSRATSTPDIICVLNEGALLSKSTAHTFGIEPIRPPLKEHILAEGSRLAVEMFYWFLAIPAANFVGRVIPLAAYFGRPSV